MISFALLLILSTTSIWAQDVVEVECSHSFMKAKVQKKLVLSANHEMETIHLNDRSCVFDGEEGEFFVKVISPLTSCGTHYEANDTHVEFSNSISTVETGPTYPYGVVVGSQSNSMVLSALISCTYRIDLNVSTQFIPNITVIVIQMPDAFGTGEFLAAMAIYTDGSYSNAYNRPPIMAADATLYVGVNLIGNVSKDIYLLVEECWGTITDDPDAAPKYPLIEDGCAVSSAADGLIRVTQNGISHQAMWNSPVFKFVGEGEAYDNVWLHCNLQLCINKSCAPTCSAKRRRKRAIGNGAIWQPSDFSTPYIISVGPIKRVTVVHSKVNGSDQTDIRIVPVQDVDGDGTVKKSSFWTPGAMVLVGGLGALACISIIVVIIVVLRTRRRSRDGVDLGATTAGVVNKSYT